MKKLFVLLVFVFLIGIVSADNFGTAKKDSCIDLVISCANCTYVNISSIQYPNQSVVVSNVITTKNGVRYNRTFCNTEVLGTYNVLSFGDDDGIITPSSDYFTVTPTGQEKIGSGEGISLFGSLFVLITISILFFAGAFVFKNYAMKIVMFGLSAVMMFITFLQSLVILDQNLGGFTELVEAYSGVWLFIKVLAVISISVLVLGSGIIAFRLWKLKRGLID